MARTRRLCTDDALKIPLHFLLELGKIRPGEYTSGWLVGSSSPRFCAWLGSDLNGWIEVSGQRWRIERYDLRGGFRLYVVGANGKRHRDLYLCQDGRVGTVSDFNFTHSTKRMRKAKRILHKRRKIFQLLKVRPGDLDWVKSHFHYPVKKPKGMWTSKFRRILNEGIIHPRKQLRHKDRSELERTLDSFRALVS